MEIINDNIINAPPRTLICHPVGALGTMTRHIGPIIKETFPSAYFDYRFQCIIKDENLFGSIIVSPIENSRKIVNMICLHGDINSEISLLDCIRKIYSLARSLDYSIAISDTIFCGLNKKETDNVMRALGELKARIFIYKAII